MAPSRSLVTDPDAKGANSTQRKIVSKLPVPKEVKAYMNRTSKRTTSKAARLFLLASLPWQSWLGKAKDAQLKMSIADCITRKCANHAGEDEEHGGSRKAFRRVPGQILSVYVHGTPWSEEHGSDNEKKANLAGKDEEDGGSKKTFQRVPGQIRPVKVPGTHWSEDYERDDGPVQTKEENAPSTDGVEGAAKRNEENNTTSKTKGGEEVERTKNKSKEYQARPLSQKLLGPFGQKST